ncbi:ABC-type sugar transport system, substrate-binding protein [Candidatus Phytoplasma solani]|uniref:extracellular solute-binding protein n=1 Tax=Candidatus Phytoplasma solani TaxID=69896 RepID=UPI0032DAC0D1
MVLKDNLKIIVFFLFAFLFLNIIILFPKTKVNDLRKNHYEELKTTLKKYKDKNKWENFKQKKLTIVFWHNLESWKNPEILKELIQKFNEEYPNITVKEEFKGNWGTLTKNINVALPANNEPHLIVSYPDFLVDYYESGKLVPLDDFILHENKEIQLKEQKEQKIFYASYEEESQIKLGKEEQKWYSLPFTKNIELMFYNQTYFKKLKERIKNSSLKDEIKNYFFDYDKNFLGKLRDDITWEQLENLCYVIKQLDPQKIPISYESESNLFIVTSAQKNIQYTNTPTQSDQLGVDFDNDEAKEMVKYFKTHFYDKKYLITRKLSGENHTIPLFFKENILMNINSSNAVDYLSKANFQVGVTSFPKSDKDKKKTLQQGANVNLFYKQNKDEVLASWLFLKYLTSKKANSILFKQESSQFPTRPDYVNTDEFKKEIEEYKKIILEKERLDVLSKEELKSLLKAKFLLFLNKERKEDEKQREEQKEPIYFFSPVFQKSYIARLVVNQLLVDCFLLDKDDKDLANKINALFETAQKKALA